MLNIIEVTFDCVSEISFIHTPHRCMKMRNNNNLEHVDKATHHYRLCTVTQSVTRVSEHPRIYFVFCRRNLIIII